MSNPVWNQEEEIIDEDLPASPQLAPPTGPPRHPRIAVGSLDNHYDEIRSEIGRMAWPTLNGVKVIMIVVLSIIIFFSLYLNMADWLIVWIGKLCEKLLRSVGMV